MHVTPRHECLLQAFTRQGLAHTVWHTQANTAAHSLLDLEASCSSNTQATTTSSLVAEQMACRKCLQSQLAVLPCLLHPLHAPAPGSRPVPPPAAAAGCPACPQAWLKKMAYSNQFVTNFCCAAMFLNCARCLPCPPASCSSWLHSQCSTSRPASTSQPAQRTPCCR